MFESVLNSLLAGPVRWVYDDPSGVPDYKPTVQPPRKPVRRPIRLVHRDC